MFEFEKYEKMVEMSPSDAKEYCKMYPKDLMAQVELIILDIIFFHEKSFENNYIELQRYYDLFKKTNNKMGLVRVASNLVFYSFDLNDIQNTKKYATTTLKYLPEYLEIKAILANVNVRLDIDLEESFEFSKKYCNSDELNQEVRNVCFSTIGDYFYKKGLFEEGHKFFEKCFLWSKDRIVLRRELLNMSLGSLKDFNLLKEDFDNYIELIENEEKKHLIHNIVDRLINENYIDEAEKYLNELQGIELNDEDEKTFILDRARIKGSKKDYDGALEELNKLSNEDIDSHAYASYLLGTTIFLKNDRRLFSRGIECLINAYNAYPTDENLVNVLNTLHMNYEYEKLEEYLKKMKDKKKPAYLYYAALIEITKGEWDKAEKLIFAYMMKIKRRVGEYTYVARKQNNITTAIFKDYAAGSTINDIRIQAIMNLHGFGVTSIYNAETAKNLLEKKIDDNGFDNCCMSVLGNAYLKLGEKEKAFSMFEKGHKRYLEYKDTCTCTTGFYCYCKAFGEGTNQDEEEAFTILDAINIRTLSDVGLYTYTHLCIKKKVNLEKAWEALENLHEWRYNIGKYYMMLKLAPLLGKATKKIKKMYKKCLKHLPMGEKLHYLDNPDSFYLTNI